MVCHSQIAFGLWKLKLFTWKHEILISIKYFFIVIEPFLDHPVASWSHLWIGRLLYKKQTVFLNQRDKCVV